MCDSYIYNACAPVISSDARTRRQIVRRALKNDESSISKWMKDHWSMLSRSELCRHKLRTCVRFVALLVL